MRILTGLRAFFFILACAIPFNLQAGAGLSFEPNLGQTEAGIRYLARTSNGIVFVTDRGITLKEGASYELLNANPSAEWIPEAATGATISYFIGRDPSKWVEDAPRYERLVRRTVYPGIDLVLYGSGEQLEYDFVVAPHADPARIRLALPGARSVSIDADGALVVATPSGELRHRKPLLTETLPDGSRRSIAGAFRIFDQHEVGFSVDGHDPALELSIDPVLESSTYFGGSGDEQVVFTDGNGTLVGMTTSIDVPAGGFRRPKGTNLFVTLQQQTFVIGCTGDVTVTSAAFRGSVNTTMAVVGYTNCVDLPTNLASFRQQPLQATYGGGATDGFLFLIDPSLNSNNNSLVLSYIGGSGDDRLNAVAQDSSGSIAMAGSTNGPGLPEAPFFSPPIQPDLAGGLDAFVLTGSPETYGTFYVRSATYLGGSEDDTALGVAILGDEVYVTGETKSPNFPLAKPQYSKRQGDSDAFIARIAGQTLAASTLFGGSGSDQSVAITMLPNGNIAVAGVTSSKDLPTKNPVQKAYGGGASDAFEAQFTGDLATLISATYIGGSEADQATSIGSSLPNTIFVGGWTASSDFPTVNPLQKTYGGGLDDGFLVHFDDDGSVYEATFFGGSGSDRVLGLTAGGVQYPGGAIGPTVWLAGTTSSPNLPLKSANQSSLRGSSDGFAAEITANLIRALPFAGAKDTRGYVSIFAGNRQLAATTTFTIKSSDPTNVEVASDLSSPGAKSASSKPQVNSGLFYFYVDCLTDSGAANLTISAPGFQSKTIPARCLPQAILLQQFYPGSGQLQTSILAQPTTINLSLGASDPQQNGLLLGGFLRPGAVPPTVQIANSSPSVGSVSASSVSLTGTYGSSFAFTPLAIGSTDLTFNAGDIPILPSDALHIAVGGSYFAPQPFSMPGGFEEPLYLYAAGQVRYGKQATITSHDPAHLLVSLDPAKKGSASVTLSASNQQGLWVQALESSGTVKLTISVPGEPDLSTTVKLTTPAVTLFYGTNTGQPIKLPVGGQTIVGFYIESRDGMAGNLRLNPGASPITFELQSSVAGVVKISPATVQLTPSGSSWFQVTGVAAGSTVLKLSNSAKIPNAAPFPSATVNVVKQPLALPDVEVGKDLMTTMTLSLPAPAASDVVITATVSDPAKALLSLDGVSPGFQQLSFIIPGGGSYASFYVYGLADSGEAKVTAAITGGYGSVTANVNLDRSGFYWYQDSLTAAFGQQNYFNQIIAAGPLDAASGLPVGFQSLRPGVSGTLQIANSNPKVVTITPTQLTLPLGSSPLQITPLSAGTATLTLQQPPGFTTPAVLQHLAVTVPKTVLSLSLSQGPIGKNTQSQLGIGGIDGNPPVTITSSDPSKVLLSTDPTKRGSGSVTVTGKPVYVQGLASSGSVTIKASAPNYTSASAPFTLMPTGFGIAFYSGVTSQNGKYVTTTQSEALSVVVNLYVGSQLSNVAFIPGLKPLTANITSSNTGVAVITGSPVTIPVNPTQGFGYNAPNTATLLQVGPGETTISISQPAGFTSLGNDRLTLDVVAPTLVINDNTVAKDTLTTGGVGIPQGVKPPSTSLAVTVTSSDPSRILLSPDAATPPAASITIAIAPNNSGASFTVHALKDNGSVAITSTAPGFSNGSSTMQLSPLLFGFTSYQGPPVNALIQAGPQTLQVGAVNTVTLRPGVPPITIGVSSSNPAVVSVSPKQIVFQGTIGNTPVTYTPLKPGTAELRLTAPSGYAVAAPLSIVAAAAKITIESASPLQIGSNLQTDVSFYAEAAKPNTEVTVTSSNPSLLLVSRSTITPGQSSVTLPSAGVGVIAQALAATGNAMLLFSSPGYPTVTLPVSIGPIGAVFRASNYEQTLLTNAGVQQAPIALVPLDPVSLQPLLQQGFPQTLRPGANLSVAVRSSDPGVIAITTPTVQVSYQPLDSGSSGPTVGIQPVAPGTAIVTLAALPGNPIPASQNQLVFTVAEPQLSMPAIALGTDLQTPVQIKLGSTVATPSADVVISVSGYNSVQLAASPSATGQSSLPVTIRAGQRVSDTFYVQGLYAGAGQVNYGGGPFPSYSTPVPVTQTAFLIQEAANGQALNLNVGAKAILTIVPALSSLSNAAAGPLSIRGGANPIQVAVTSDNPGVAVPSPSQVTFNPGDQQQIVSLQGLSAGTATIKLLGSNYDFSQPQASIQVVVK